MCAQCMVTAATVAAGATGLRAWLAARGFSWVTPQRLRRLSAGIIAVGLAVVAVGSG